MMIQELEGRTGFYPSQDLYSFIEEAYTKSNLDKDAFCKAYKQNENGMAEAIARKASITRIIEADKAEKENHKKISGLEKEVERLKAQLEREQEWKPYESDHNVKQADYERLASGIPNGTYYMVVLLIQFSLFLHHRLAFFACRLGNVQTLFDVTLDKPEDDSTDTGTSENDANNQCDDFRKAHCQGTSIQSLSVNPTFPRERG